MPALKIALFYVTGVYCLISPATIEADYQTERTRSGRERHHVECNAPGGTDPKRNREASFIPFVGC